jgi:Phasin protein
MSKRKAATASKHARSPKIAAKAQRANQAIVRSPKDSRLRSVTAVSSPKRHKDSKQEAPLVESPAAALPDDFKQTMRDNDSNKGFDFSSASSATASVRTYQAKLLEMAQANMQFALEFAQRLATIRSPLELLRVIEELTTKRIAMFRKYSKEIVELSTKR